MKGIFLLYFFSIFLKSPEVRLSLTYNFPGGDLQKYIRGGGNLRVSTFFSNSPWLSYGTSAQLSKYSGIGDSRYFFTLKGIGFHLMGHPFYRFWKSFSIEGGIDQAYIYRAVDKGKESDRVVILSLNSVFYLIKERYSLFIEFPFQWIPGDEKWIFLYGLGFGVSLKWGLEPGLK